MKYSKLFGKTKKHSPKDETSFNAQLLTKAGFIQKEMAGVYAFLPLGYRSLQKVIQIIREEMNKIGGQEIHLGALQNPEVWKASNRWSDETIDVWFKTKLKNGSEVGLATTHEEPLTKMMLQHIKSYKDLPLYVYQFQTKFRNELRARSGLLRTREFIMKDLYSFNKTSEDLESFYERAKEAYFNVYERSGIGKQTFLTFASGGAFCKYSHEFQTICKNGEDTIYLDRKKRIAVNKEVYNDTVLKDLDLKKKNLEKVNATEVGNIFKLGTRFSEALNLTCINKEGKDINVVMGSYGIGPARLLAAIVELYNDDKGITWPITIAPFQVHLISLGDDSNINSKAEDLHKSLLKENVEVLWDDRSDISAGIKFNDADLIGIPIRIVVSKRSLSRDGVELKLRSEEKESIFELDKVVDVVKQKVELLQKEFLIN